MDREGRVTFGVEYQGRISPDLDSDPRDPKALSARNKCKLSLYSHPNVPGAKEERGLNIQEPLCTKVYSFKTFGYLSATEELWQKRPPTL